jgi:hypothetical protein
MIYIYSCIVDYISKLIIQMEWKEDILISLILYINMKIIYHLQVFIPSNTRILRKDKILKKIKAR